MLEKYNILMGYDNRGILYEESDYIIRKIYSEYFDNSLEIYDFYKKFNLNKLGIVDTELVLKNDKNFFKHQKYIISYPYEWTANMLKDAVLFFLELIIELDQFNLTLKDAVPSNILFDFTKPVFVDFLSIIKKSELKNEVWLFDGVQKKFTDNRFLVFEKMFFPFMLIPFFCLTKKNYELSRNMLLNGACNIKDCKQPIWNDLYLSGSKINKKLIFEDIKTWYLYSLIKFKKRLDFISFCKWLLDLVKSFDVSPIKSSYASYYKLKQEDFSFENKLSWKIKQKNVYKIIQKNKPKTVLDLGANTGWFSILACKNGANVIATDIDESCVDNLYKYSCEKNLKLLPLLLSFDDLETEKYGIIDSLYFSKERNYNKKPIFMSPIRRLNSDMVFCLALVHHLVLGQGKSIDEIFSVLSKLSNKVLVLEYISLDDNLIKNDPSFFEKLNRFSEDNYNIELFIKEGKKYFHDVELLDSHPNTRKLLVFSR